MIKSTAYSLLLFALTLSTCCCTSKEKEENLGLDFDFKEIPDYAPGTLPDWKAAVFVFNGDKCSSAGLEESLGNITKINASSGDQVTIVAYQSDSNLGFSALNGGMRADSYSLLTLDSSSESGEIWYATGTIDGSGAALSIIPRPLTSAITLTVNDKPEGYEYSNIAFSGFSNRWDVHNDSLRADHSSTVTCRVTEGTHYVLPLQSNLAALRPSVELAVGGRKFNPVFPALPKLSKGQSLAISIDLKDFTERSSYHITFTARDIVSGKELYTTTKSYVVLEDGANRHYAVSICSDGEWKKLDVHDALCSNPAKHAAIWNDWSNKKGLRDTMSYCIFENDFNGPVRIRVRKLEGTFNSCEIRPTPYKIKAEILSFNEIEFTIPSYDMRKVSVEFDGDRYHNLFLYGHRPDKDKPAQSSPTVIYYGPGVHEPGKITLDAGQTLYLDYGAKVYANVVTNGSGVTIAGHGILSGEKMAHFGDNQYSWGDFLVNCNENGIAVKDLTVKDITMIDSPGWNLCIRNTESVIVNGVNMISWELNGDGVDIVSCKDVEIANCFLRNYDDCVTLKCRFIVNPITDVSGVRIHDNLIWNDYARGIVIGPEAGKRSDPGHIHDVDVRDCIFLEHGNGGADDLRAAFCIGQGSDGRQSLWSGTAPPMPVSDITASNLTFDNIRKYGRAIAIRQYAASDVVLKNVTLENFNILDSNGNIYPAFYIWTAGASIEGLKIKGLTYNGNKIDAVGSQFRIDKPERVDYTIE